jgi:hypothetical protein
MRILKLSFLLSVLVLINASVQGQNSAVYVWTNFAGHPGGPGNADGTGGAARFNGPTGLAVDSATNLYVADTFNHTIRKLTPIGGNWVVTTLAGLAGTKGSADGTGNAARFNKPYGVTVDSAGNVYVADTYNDTIRKVTSSGVVTTLAGRAGSAGSVDGRGGMALFSVPRNLTVDSAGKVYVADNCTIRTVTSDGLVVTLAGSAGYCGWADDIGGAARFWVPSGVAVDGVGYVWVADSGNDVIRRVTSAGAVQTLAGSNGSVGCAGGTLGTARFNNPSGVVLDSAGNVYVADTDNHTIRMLTSNGTVVTLAGSCGNSGSADGTNGAAQFNKPYGIAIDRAGNLYLADTFNQTIRMVTPVGTNWVVTTIAGCALSTGSANGTNLAARFNGPSGVAVDRAGSLYVADTTNCTVRKVTSAGVVTTLAGSPGNRGCANGTGSGAQFSNPYSVAVDTNGNVFVADTGNCDIRKVTSGGAVTALAGQCGTCGSVEGTGSAAQFNQPRGVAADSAGNVYVADTLNDTIRKVTSGGMVTPLAGVAGSPGTNDGAGIWASFNQPYGVAVDGATNLYFADTYNHTIRKASPVGTDSWVVTTLAGLAGVSGANDGTNGEARFSYPSSVAVDTNGNVFVADTGNRTIRKVTPVGINWVVTTIGGIPGVIGGADGIGASANFSAPWGIAVDSAGSLYVVDANENRISKGTPSLPVLTTRQSGSSVIVSWPSAYKGFVLQQNSNLPNASSWQATTYPITDNGTNKSIAVPSPTTHLLFRLVGN